MRVVLGIDGSAPSLIAHQLLLEASWPRPLEVALVATYERPIDWSGTIPVVMSVDDEEAMRRDLTDMLDGLAEPLRAAGIVPELVVREGSAAHVLEDVARERRADLLLVGNRGRGPARSAFLGSVSASLVDHAPCPVLVARRPRVDRLLLATDGTSTADRAADIFLRWRIFRNAPVDVVSVAPHRRSTAETLVTPWSVSGDLRDVPAWDSTGDHRAFAEQLAAHLRGVGLTAQASVRAGDAATEITAAAAELGDDLVVTGSRGLGDIRRLLVGSVAHDVLLHARTSVLVMRGVVHATSPEVAPAALHAAGVA